MSTMSTNIPLRHLPLRPSSLEALQGAGFVATNELIEAKSSGGIGVLASELQVGEHEALSIFTEVMEITQRQTSGKSALVLLQRKPQMHIITFCRDLDQLLGGGIPLSDVTEIAGPPGIAKTNLCMQLSVNATLPALFGGVDGDTIYIDTEGSFSPERCHAMAEQLIRHIHAGIKRRKQAASWNVTAESLLERIRVYRAHTVWDLVAVLESLDDSPLKRCRLIIIDSIALPFRAIPADVARTRLLATIAARLTHIAQEHELAVVCINQQVQGGVALGESWAHAVANRLTVSFVDENDSKREAILVKAARMPIGTAEFQVTEAGIRGVEHVALKRAKLGE